MDAALQRERILSPATPVPDFRLLFESLPGLFVVVLPDHPNFTVVAVSDAYLRATKKMREEILGHSLFEVFPGGPDPSHAETIRNLRASFARVLAQRQHDSMPVQHYNVERPKSEGGGFEERYWSPVNSPVLGATGVQFIIHRVEDVTEFVRLRRTAEEQGKPAGELRDAFPVDDPTTQPAHFATITRDLRQRKRSEVELRESDARFRTMADSAPVLIWMSDTTKGSIWFNRPWLEFTGRTLEQEYGYGWTESVHPEDAQRCVDIYNNSFDRREPFQLEYRLRRHDGSWRWMLDHAVPLFGADGAFAGFIGSSIDITERRDAEEILRESEARLRFLTELDDATRPLTDPSEITQTAARMLGERLRVNRCAYADVEADENTFNLTGDYNRGVESIVGRYTFDQFGEECLRLMREGQPYIVTDSETDPRTESVIGAYRLTQIRSVICVPLLKAGRFVAAMAVHQATPRDWAQNEVELLQSVAGRCWESIERVHVARELREREQRYRFLAESIPQMVWTATPDGMLDYVNRQGSEYFGVPPEPLLGAGWLEWVHPQDREKAVERWTSSLATGKSYETAFRLRRGRDESWRWHLVRALPLTGEGGNVIQWFGTCTDIEDQKQAESDLHQQWKTFDTALSHTPDFTYTFDLEGRFTYVNRSLLSLWQRPLHDALGKNFFDLDYPPDLAGRLQRQIQQVIETRQPVRDQTPFTSPTGEIGYYEYIFVPVLGPDGRVEAVAGSTRDITDVNRAAQQIDEDRRRWRELLLQTPAAIAILRGPELRFEWINRDFARMVGRTTEAVVGKTVLEALPEVEGQIYFELLNGVYRTGDPFSGRESLIRLDRGDGTLEDIYVNFVYLPTKDLSGAIDGIFCHVTDVTGMVVARQRIEESERQFRTLAETIPNLAWMADHTGYIFWYNRRWYDYTGTTLEEMEGWGWEKVHDAAVLPEVLKEWKFAIETGNPFEMVFPLKGADGVFRSFLTRVQPVRDNQGQVVRWFGTNTDITQQRRTEEELRRMNRELEEFAYVASHDLQEPLRMVNIYTQLILKRFAADDERLNQYAGFVRQGVTRMEALIQDLLSFSRAVHTEELPVSTSDLSAALSEAVSVLKNRIEESGAVIAAQSLPAVRGDTAQLAHVFQNLLSNALKYRKKETDPEVQISARLEGEQWIISVRDNGIGFEQKYAERIFGLFKRLHKHEYPGTGLGLAICKRIVERYGGHMWAESILGEGATFHFSLPRVKAD